MSRAGVMAEQVLPVRPGACLHMTGIGGVGMAGLAVLLKAQGYRITGCDKVEGTLLPWLREQGISCSVGHDPGHLSPPVPDAVVRSPAVHHDEPELLEATRLGLPVVDRGRVLPGLLRGYRTAAVAGTHGKTTTASLLAWILLRGGIRTSFIIGGVCPSLGAVARVERDGAMVIEADESDGTLQFYHPEVAVITNLDLDHVDYFRDVATQHAVFTRFAAQSGCVIWPHGVPGAEDVVAGLSVPALSFGLDAAAGVRAERIQCGAQGSDFDLCLGNEPRVRVTLGVPGQHNVLNALAAVAAARTWAIPGQVLADALASFRLPKRRFELVVDNGEIRVFTDYAHHPAELDALIRQARLLGGGRVIGVFQPHRYSRTRAFKTEFAASLSALDHVVIAPVYAASEDPVEGGSSADLYAEFPEARRSRVALADSLETAWKILREATRAGDVVLVIGAGDVEKIAAWAALHWAA